MIWSFCDREPLEVLRYDRILTDSASDILPAEAEQLGVTVIPLNVTFGGQHRPARRRGHDPTEYYGILAGCLSSPHHQPAQPGAVRELLHRSGRRRGRGDRHLPVPRVVRHLPVRQARRRHGQRGQHPLRGQRETSASASRCWSVWPSTCGIPARTPGRSRPFWSTPRSTCTSWPSSTT